MQGDWSDHSSLWDANPAAKRVCKPQQDAADGCFWISWQDFTQYYQMVDVCARTRTMQDLSLNLHEELGPADATYGCNLVRCRFL